MATKPTKRILDWASTGSITDPGGSKEAAGWVVDERPPAEWLNWILQSYGDWFAYLEDITDELVAQPRASYAAHLEAGTTPQVVWEKGDSVTLTDSGGNALWLDFTNTYATNSNSVLITTHIINTDCQMFSCSWNTTQRLVIECESDAGVHQDLNAQDNGVDPRFFIAIFE